MAGKFNYTLAKEIIKQKKITQQELAHRLFDFGIVVQLDAIKSWFRKNDKARNTPKLSTIQAIAKILDVKIDDLVIDDKFLITADNINVKGNNNITQNQNISGSNNVVFGGNGCDGTNTSDRLQSKTMRKFLDLYAEYGNDKMLLQIIEKLEQMKRIAES